LFLDAGLLGGDAPRPEAFAPVWQAWNARSPQQQAADGLRADAELTQRFEALGRRFRPTRKRMWLRQPRGR
jgi:hypothetical protein